MTTEQLIALADEICKAGFPEKYSFQDRGNRDFVAGLVANRGGKVAKSSTANQSIDPRYTVEGRHLPDRGMANDRIHTNLYHLERTY